MLIERKSRKKVVTLKKVVKKKGQKTIKVKTVLRIVIQEEEISESDANIERDVKPLGQIKMGEKKNPRIPRKKDNKRFKKHSDLYTDENPKGTIKGLKFVLKDANIS